MANLNTKISFHFSKLLESANGSYLVLHDEQEKGQQHPLATRT